MARLPVFHSNANISATNPVAPPPQSNVWEQAGKLAKIGQELAVKWQETQNAAETLDGKYKAESAMSDILQEANDYSGYESPKDIENKQNELLARNDAVLDDVTKGFTNDVNATKFRRQYMFDSMRNREQIKAAFRKKSIDLNNANLTIGYERNKNSFVETGDPAYKASYQADLDNSFKAGFIDAEQRANMSAKMNDWDFSRASRNVVANPEETLANIKEYNLKPEESQKIIKAAATQIENNKWMKGINELVEKGTEGNRLYNKFMEQGLSLDEIQNNTTISESEKTALMKLAGYDTPTFKNAQKAADTITAQLELDEKIKQTVKESGSKVKLQKDKEISDLLDLREDVYKALISGDIKKDKASLYMNQIIGAELNEAKKLASEGNKSAKAGNPYAEGLIQIDDKLASQGIDNKKIMSSVHNLYFEALQDQLAKENPDGLSWSELSDTKKQEIQNKAVAYAMSNVPSVAQAKEEFSYFLPASKRKAALDDFMNRYNPEMTDAQKKELVKDITAEQRQKAEAETNMALANATYNFEADESFLTENGISKEDVIFTAQKYGVSVEEVLQKIRGNEQNAH